MTARLAASGDISFDWCFQSASPISVKQINDASLLFGAAPYSGAARIDRGFVLREAHEVNNVNRQVTWSGSDSGEKHAPGRNVARADVK